MLLWKCGDIFWYLRALERDPHSAGSRHLGHEQLMILWNRGERLCFQDQIWIKMIFGRMVTSPSWHYNFEHSFWSGWSWWVLGKLGTGQFCEIWNVKVWECESVRVWESNSVRLWECEIVKVWRCEDVRMWYCEGVKVIKCHIVKVWNSESVKVWECESVRAWKCGSVKVWE